MRVFIKYPDKPEDEHVDGSSDLTELSFFKLDKGLKAKLTTLARMTDIPTAQAFCTYVALIDFNDIEAFSIYYCSPRSFEPESGICVGYLDLTMPTREIKSAIEEKIHDFWKEIIKTAETELSLRA